MAREYFCAYHSYLRSMRKLSDAECGRLFRALLQYSAGEQLINLQGREEAVFDFMTDQIDRDNEKYEAKCARNRENGKKRTVPNASERYRTLANGSQDKDKDKGKDKDKDKDKEKENTSMGRAPRFVPPTVEEVDAYCKERGNQVDPQRFVDYYEANGWKVGRNPMKDWKAAVRTWEKNGFYTQGKQTSQKQAAHQEPGRINYAELERKSLEEAKRWAMEAEND